MRFPRVVFLSAAGALLFCLAIAGTAQRNNVRSADADWPMFNRDLAGTRFSPLTQINTANVSQLTQAWSYKLRPHDGKPLTGQSPNEMFQEITPVVVNGVMYLPAANRVVALEPETGKEIWRFPVVGGAPSRRGVAYWPGDGARPANIIFTAGRRLIAINARTGTPDRAFGQAGEVDM